MNSGGASAVTVRGDAWVHLVLHGSNVTMCKRWSAWLKVTDTTPTCPTCIAQAELNARNAQRILDIINGKKPTP